MKSKSFKTKIPDFQPTKKLWVWYWAKKRELFCIKCMATIPVKIPIGKFMLQRKIDSFAELHKDCKLTPEVKEVLAGLNIPTDQLPDEMK